VLDAQQAKAYENDKDIKLVNQLRSAHLKCDVPAFGNGDTRFAYAAGFDRRPTLPVRPNAVECFGDEPGSRRLADPAHAGQQKGVGQPIALDRIAQCLHHRVLADQLGEAPRPIFASQHTIGRRHLRLRRLVEAQWKAVVGFGRHQFILEKQPDGRQPVVAG